MIPLGAAGLWASRLRGGGVVLERDVYLSVTLAWMLAAFLGGIPYVLEGTFTSFLDYTFEGMSGFTTTGATLLAEIEAETPSILFWRSMTQWLGGIGIVVLFVAVAPAIGAGAARLLGAEVSGLTRTRLTPRIADTAKVLIVIYLAISIAETLALLLVGMPLYDAVVHTFATVATGGFSPKTASIAFYDSLAVEAVIIVFMTLSAVSFSLYYLLYARRRFDVVLDREVLTYLAVLVGAVLFVWGVLVFEGDYGDSWGLALRDAAFTVSSIMTTTGFVTADFDEWDTAAKYTLVVLMFVGGCAGSTAGGIKVIRVLIIFRTNSQGIFRMGAPPRGDRAEDRRSDNSREGAHGGSGALRRLDSRVRPGDVPRRPPRRPHADLRFHRGGRHAQRDRAGAGPGRGLGELRGGQPLRARGANGVHAPGEA
jgi:trk system potassium uptake protein TrkH